MQLALGWLQYQAAKRRVDRQRLQRPKSLLGHAFGLVGKTIALPRRT